MPEAALELRAILDSAERAASVQDFPSAEHYLRQAAALQESQLGATHPELANTLNNLGIVCERTDKPSEAEACYRRAFAIASATLPPEDPLVLTSGQNLRDFCAATGRPFEPAAPPPPPPAPMTAPPSTAPASPSAALPSAALASASAAAPGSTSGVMTPPALEKSTPPAPPTTTVSPTPAPQKPSAPVTPPPSRPVAPPSTPVPFAPRAAAPPSPPIRVDPVLSPPGQGIEVTPSAVPVGLHSSSRTRAVWVVVGIVLAVILAIVLANRFLRADANEPAVTPEEPRPQTAAPREQPPPPAASSAPETPIAEAPEAPPVTSPPKQPAPVEVPSGSEPRAPANSDNARAAPTTVSLAESKLCRTLSNWRCTPADDPATPGAFVFYTRVKSPRDTTVQHRWYLNGNLRRSVDLRISANPGEGYRTYSRNTIAAERRGNWTIELRDASGALLHEERFVVQ